ncbi:hypothetical protein FOA52_010396 [Chlamydomonas sp. UWO 241]|nr:hypothetical protein FOA52_010396 [Chlamydomonas sp. UWO 241]
MSPLLRLAASAGAGARAAAAGGTAAGAGGAALSLGAGYKELINWAGSLDALQRSAACRDLLPLLLAATAGSATASAFAPGPPYLPLVFDFETEGLTTSTCMGIEVAMWDLASGTKFDTLIKTGIEVPRYVTKVNGITSWMVYSAPPTAAVSLALGVWLLQRSLAASGGTGVAPLLIAHNVDFDVKFLAVLLSHASLPLPPGWTGLDTMDLARTVLTKGSGYDGKHSLPVLVDHFKVAPVGTAHRAAADVHVLCGVMQHLLGVGEKELGQQLCAGTSRASVLLQPIGGQDHFVSDVKTVYGRTWPPGRVGSEQLGALLARGNVAARDAALIRIRAAAAGTSDASGSSAAVTAASAASAPFGASVAAGAAAAAAARPAAASAAASPLSARQAGIGGLGRDGSAASTGRSGGSGGSGGSSGSSGSSAGGFAPGPAAAGRQPGGAPDAARQQQQQQVPSPPGPLLQPPWRTGSQLAEMSAQLPAQQAELTARAVAAQAAVARPGAAHASTDAGDPVAAQQSSAPVSASTTSDGAGADAGGVSDGEEGGSGRCEPGAQQHAFRGIVAAQGGKWRAKLNDKGRHLYLGIYATQDEAARAWDAKAVELRGPGTYLNFPGDSPAAQQASAPVSASTIGHGPCGSGSAVGGASDSDERGSGRCEPWTAVQAEAAHSEDFQAWAKAMDARAEADRGGAVRTEDPSGALGSAMVRADAKREVGVAEVETKAESLTLKAMEDLEALEAREAGAGRGRRGQRDVVFAASAERHAPALTPAPAPAPAPAMRASVAAAAPAEEWEPCGVDLSSKVASKWFPLAQRQKLLNSGFKTLLQVLMFYPRRHVEYAVAIDPAAPQQDVVVQGTVVKASVSPRGTSGAVLNIVITVDTPTADGSGSSGSEGSPVPVTVHSSQFTAGRWAQASLRAICQQHREGRKVILRGTLKAKGWAPDAEPTASSSGSGQRWDEYECGNADLFTPAEFDPAAQRVACAYSSRGELKPADFVDRGKRRGAIGRALEVLEAHGAAASVNPLAALPPAARRLLDDAVDAPPESTWGALMSTPLAGMLDAAGALPLPPPEALMGGAAVAGSGGGAWLRALRELHRPSSPEALVLARRRLAVTEMALLQLQLLERRRRLTALHPDRRAPSCASPALIAKATSTLPFELTSGQAGAVREVLRDMEGGRPMFRLLQGDVGSGKTIVAFLAMLAAAGAGHQALLLAPTEILAEQHYAQLCSLLEGLPLSESAQLSACLLTGSSRNRRDLLDEIASGRHRLLVGTHSLLFVPKFASLGLVVIDEQHRFGVRQKETLTRMQADMAPHVLSLSATPIPRTIALVHFGDMAASALRERPPGRSPVETRVVPDNKQSREDVFKAVRRELDSGGKAFIVYPLREPSLVSLIDDKDDGGGGLTSKQGAKRAAADLRSAEVEFARLKKNKSFGAHAAALLHGRMSSAEKTAVLASFRDGRTPALVCTVVVEVGVDVPDASIMVVEHAERFGLAQLHQLRGRVGRGKRQSSCYLLTPDTEGGEEGQEAPSLERLRVLEGCHDGFLIAEADLAMRGAGNVFGTGTRQSGGLDASALCQKEISADPRLVEAARSAALLMMRGLSSEGDSDSGSSDGSLGEAAVAAAAPLPASLAGAATAFTAAVRARQRARLPSVFGDDEDDGSDEQEVLGTAG